VGVGVDIAQVVDGDQIELVGVALEQGLGDLPTDTAKAINCDFCSHEKSPLREFV